MTTGGPYELNEGEGGGDVVPSLAVAALAFVEALHRLLQAEVAVAEAQLSRGIRILVWMAVTAILAGIAAFVALIELAAALAALFQMLGLPLAISHLAAAAAMLGGAIAAAMLVLRQWRRLCRWPGQSFRRLRREAASVVHAFRRGLNE